MHAHARPKPEVHLFSFAVLFPFIFIGDVPCCSQEHGVCVLTSFARPTYHHKYVPSSVHTSELTVLLSKIKFIIVLCACAFHLINFLLPVWYLLRWSSADFFLHTVCWMPVSWLYLITYVPYSWMFCVKKKHQNKTKFVKLTIMFWVEQNDGECRWSTRFIERENKLREDWEIRMDKLRNSEKKAMMRKK